MTTFLDKIAARIDPAPFARLAAGAGGRRLVSEPSVATDALRLSVARTKAREIVKMIGELQEIPVGWENGRIGVYDRGALEYFAADVLTERDEL